MRAGLSRRGLIGLIAKLHAVIYTKPAQFETNLSYAEGGQPPPGRGTWAGTKRVTIRPARGYACPVSGRTIPGAGARKPSASDRTRCRIGDPLDPW